MGTVSPLIPGVPFYTTSTPVPNTAPVGCWDPSESWSTCYLKGGSGVTRPWVISLEGRNLGGPLLQLRVPNLEEIRSILGDRTAFEDSLRGRSSGPLQFLNILVFAAL